MRPLHDVCGCEDPACPGHDQESCEAPARTTVYRVAAGDEDGTPMCDACARRALDSGAFQDEDDAEDEDA